MIEFKVLGNVDPFLLVSLSKGESIVSDSGSMVSMDSCLDLKGKAKGGLIDAIARKTTTGESFFQQVVNARESGSILLSPTLPGDIKILDVGTLSYFISDGCFLAATLDVVFNTKTQSLSKMIFGGTGGAVIMQASGSGTLAISGFGAISPIDVTPGHNVVIDNNHVVAWDTRLEYSVSVSTQKSNFISNLINSAKSGEGMVTVFSGTGKVYVCSKNRQSFVGWISSLILPKTQK